MMNKKDNMLDFLKDVKEDISKYLDLRLKLLKIEVYEKAGKISSVLSVLLIIFFVAFFAILFLFLALGFYWGNLLGSLALGMCLVGGIYILVLLTVILFRKKIMGKIFNLFITELIEDDEEENK